jgi:predicted secreted hydrolase
MIVVHDYRGYGFHVDAVPANDGRWNAEVKVRQHFPFDAKPHVEVVTCFKVSAALAEAAGELWAKRWVDLQATERDNNNGG